MDGDLKSEEKTFGSDDQEMFYQLMVVKHENTNELSFLESQEVGDNIFDLDKYETSVKLEATERQEAEDNNGTAGNMEEPVGIAAEMAEREVLGQCNETDLIVHREPEELEEGEIENDQDIEPDIPAIEQQKKPVSFKNHRGLEESSDSSDSSSSDSEIVISDNDSETEPANVPSNKQLPVKKTVKAHGEISIEDLPPMEELQITVGDDVKLVEIGTVLHCVGVLVVVESKPNLPPLDADTILFLEGKKVLGQVFDTIGQVSHPCYVVRFNRESEIEERGIKSGMSVFCAPDSPDWTRYVFLAHVMKIRGSDASWEHDNEPPVQFIDYSDDEAERAAKAKRRGRDNANNDNASNADDNNQAPTAKCSKAQGAQNANKEAGRRNRKPFRNNLPGSQPQSSQNSGEPWSSQPLTSWPPKFGNQRPVFKGAQDNAWHGPPGPRMPRFCRPPPHLEARFPLPDLSQPPPAQRIPPMLPPSFAAPHPAQSPPGPVAPHPSILPCRMGPSPHPAFQATNPMQWRPFQNVPPFSFSAAASGPQCSPFFSAQIPPPFDVRSTSWTPGGNPPSSCFPPRPFHYPYPPS